MNISWNQNQTFVASVFKAFFVFFLQIQKVEHVILSNLEWHNFDRFQIVLPGHVSLVEEEVCDLGGVQLRANHPHPLLHLLPLQEPGPVLVNKVKRLAGGQSS